MKRASATRPFFEGGTARRRRKRRTRKRKMARTEDRALERDRPRGRQVVGRTNEGWKKNKTRIASRRLQKKKKKIPRRRARLSAGKQQSSVSRHGARQKGARRNPDTEFFGSSARRARVRATRRDERRRRKDAKGRDVGKKPTETLRAGEEKKPARRSRRTRMTATSASTLAVAVSFARSVAARSMTHALDASTACAVTASSAIAAATSPPISSARLAARLARLAAAAAAASSNARARPNRSVNTRGNPSPSGHARRSAAHNGARLCCGASGNASTTFAAASATEYPPAIHAGTTAASARSNARCARGSSEASDARCARTAPTSRTCVITPRGSVAATAARSANAASRAGPASASCTARTTSGTSHDDSETVDGDDFAFAFVLAFVLDLEGVAEEMGSAGEADASISRVERTSAWAYPPEASPAPSSTPRRVASSSSS